MKEKIRKLKLHRMPLPYKKIFIYVDGLNKYESLYSRDADRVFYGYDLMLCLEYDKVTKTLFYPEELHVYITCDGNNKYDYDYDEIIIDAFSGALELDIKQTKIENYDRLLSIHREGVKLIK